MKRAQIRIHHVLSRQLAFIVVAIVFSICICWLAIQVWRVKAAFDTWIYLKTELHPDLDAVKKALDRLNDEERLLIPPMAFGLASTVSVLKSINPKILPRRCVYCGCWMGGKDASHSPDRLFWYHEACLLRREKKSVQIAVIEPASAIITREQPLRKA